MKKNLTLIGILLLIKLSPTTHARTWTSYNGKKIEAEYISMINPETVKIKIQLTGQNFLYPVKNFSTSDQKFLKPHIDEAKELLKLRKELYKKLNRSSKFAELKVLQVLKNGLLVNSVKVIHFSGRSSSLGSIGGGGGASGGGSRKVSGNEIFYLMYYPEGEKDIFDGDLITGYFANVGTYSYSTVSGARKTIPKLAFIKFK
jgi:hypothetical protein